MKSIDKNGNNFFSKLMEETLVEVHQETQEIINHEGLRSYFEEKSQESLLENQLAKAAVNSFTLEDYTEYFFYRLIINDLKLDFPSNWFVFSDLREGELILLGDQEDDKVFIDVFSPLIGDIHSIAFYQKNKILNMFFFKQDKKFLERDFSGDFILREKKCA